MFQEVEIISLLAVRFVRNMELIQRSKCLLSQPRDVKLTSAFKKAH